MGRAPDRGADRVDERVLTVPNALTLFRLLSVPVIVALLLGGWDIAGSALLALAAATDFLDGFLARRIGPNRVGRVLDPAADRLLVSSVCAALAIRGLLPVWAVVVLIGRDVLALLGSALLGDKMRVIGIGKVATATLMVAVVVVALKGGVVGEIVFYAGFVLSVAAVFVYGWSAWRAYRRGGIG